MRVTLPSGGWADLIEVEALRAAHTRQIEKHWLRQGALSDAAAAEGKKAIDPETWANHASGLPNLIMQIAVLAWELPYSPGAKLPRDNPPRIPSPNEPEGFEGWLDDISPKDYRALRGELDGVRRILLNLDTEAEDGATPAPAPTDAVVLPGTNTLDPASPTPPASGPESDSAGEDTSSPTPATVSSVAGIGQPDSGGGSTGTG